MHNVNFPNVLHHVPTNIPICSLGLKSPNNMMIFVKVSDHISIWRLFSIKITILFINLLTNKLIMVFHNSKIHAQIVLTKIHLMFSMGFWIIVEMCCHHSQSNFLEVWNNHPLSRSDYSFPKSTHSFPSVFYLGVLCTSKVGQL